MTNILQQLSQQAVSSASPADNSHACRPSCGACCIAPSISSAIPGMPLGKPAGVRCIQLTATYQCAIFGLPERPACCSGLKPETDMCGTNQEYAIRWLSSLEELTQPDKLHKH